VNEPETSSETVNLTPPGPMKTSESGASFPTHARHCIITEGERSARGSTKTSTRGREIDSTNLLDVGKIVRLAGALEEMSERRRKEELSMLVVKDRKDSRLQKVAKS